MKILICGSSGFIGSHLVRHLARMGHTVFGLDLVLPASQEGLTGFTQGDILKKETLWPALVDMDGVINLAAKHHDSGITTEEYFLTNETGTRCLLECMTDMGIKRFVYFSSVSVYGANRTLCDEQSQLLPQTPYGQSKVAAEIQVCQWQRSFAGRTTVILRPSLVFGEGNLANMYSLIRQIDKGLFIFFGSRQVAKSTCYVGNLVAATGWCLERLRPGVRIYNYVDKEDLTVGQMVEMIAASLQVRRRFFSLPLWTGVLAGRLFDLLAGLTGRQLRVSAARVQKLAMSTCFAAEAIRRDGFVPPYSLPEGLYNMTLWYRQNRLSPARPAAVDLPANLPAGSSIVPIDQVSHTPANPSNSPSTQ